MAKCFSHLLVDIHQAVGACWELTAGFNWSQCGLLLYSHTTLRDHLVENLHSSHSNSDKSDFPAGGKMSWLLHIFPFLPHKSNLSRSTPFPEIVMSNSCIWKVISPLFTENQLQPSQTSKEELSLTKEKRNVEQLLTFLCLDHLLLTWICGTQLWPEI